MDDADIARDALDKHFADEVTAAESALAEAWQRLADWRQTGIASRDGLHRLAVMSKA